MVCVIHSDQDTVLQGKNLQSWTHNKGIIVLCSALHAHEQNGKAEVAGLVLLTMAKTLRIEARLPEDLWPEFLRTATCLANDTPTKSSGWKTPIAVINEFLNRHALVSLSKIRILG